MTRRTFEFSLRITLGNLTCSISTQAVLDTTVTQLLQLNNDRGTQVIIWTSIAWYKTAISEQWSQDATSTQTLSSPGRKWYTTVIWTVTVGRNY